MAVTQEYKGQWWLPGKEDDKVSGILYYTPGESLLLELIGNFKDGSQDPFEELINVHRVETIFGQSSDGKDITLFDSGCNLQRTFKADYPVARYHPREIAIGMHINSINDKLFHKAIVKIPELSYWLYPGMLIQELVMDENECQCINIRMKHLTDKERQAYRVTASNKYSFTLLRSASYEGSELLFEPSFKQFTQLQIEKPGNASFKSFYENAVRFERFLSLAMLKEVSYSELSLYCEDCFKCTVGEKKIYIPIIIDTVFHDAPSEKTVGSHKFLFNYQDIQEQYKPVIKKWFVKDSNFDAIRGHFLEAIDYHGKFSYVNFLIVIQAIEGYARRYRLNEAKARQVTNGHKKITLHDYIEAILFEYKDVRRVNQKIDISAITQTRDYHSHLLEQQKKKKVDGEDLYYLTNELRKILVCCIMTYLGFSNMQIDKFTWETSSPVFEY